MPPPRAGALTELFAVVFNWVWNYLTCDQAPRIILRPSEHEPGDG